MVAADNNLGFIPTDGPLRNVFYDGADRLVGFTDTELIVWATTTHERISSIRLPAPLLDGQLPNLVRASVAGGRAAWVDTSSVAHTVRLDRPDQPVSLGPDAAAVAVHPDGERVAVAGVGGDLRLVALPSGAELWVIPGDPAMTFDDQTPVDLSPIPALANIQLRQSGFVALAFAPDGQRLIHARGILVHDIDIATGIRTRTLDTVQPGGLGYTYSSFRGLSFTPGDNPRLIASSLVVLSAYDSSTWELRSRFNPIRRLAVILRPSPDCRTVGSPCSTPAVSWRSSTRQMGASSAGRSPPGSRRQGPGRLTRRAPHRRRRRRGRSGAGPRRRRPDPHGCAPPVGPDRRLRHPGRLVVGGRVHPGQAVSRRCRLGVHAGPVPLPPIRPPTAGRA